MSHIRRVFNAVLLRRSYLYNSSDVRFISTSNKKDDTTTIVGPTTIHSEDKITEPKKKKYFQDYGFNGLTEKEETFNMHFTFFVYITLGFTLSLFYFAYRPDVGHKDWGLREAYLELRRREQLGLPVIDPNYVDPSTIYIPSDEELGDTEIII